MAQDLDRDEPVFGGDRGRWDVAISIASSLSAEGC
jgi:hypothetical protein